MALIPDDAKAKLARHFAEQLKDPVSLTLFVRRALRSKSEDEPSPAPEPHGTSLEALELLGEVTSLSEKLNCQVMDLATSPETRMRDDIPIPTILVDRGLPRIASAKAGAAPAGIFGQSGAADGDEPMGSSRIRYVGLPAGNEFPNFIQLLIDVSKGDSGLTEKSRNALSGLTAPMHLRVFVTPT